MNILYINHYAGSPEMGMEFRPYYLSSEWVKMGHKVTIIAGDYSHVRRKNPEVEKDFKSEEIDGIEYVWVKTGSYKGNGLKRAKSMFRFVWKLLTHVSKISKEFKPDVVIASSTYPLDTYPAQRIARVSKAKYIHEVHDMWPATLYEVGGMSKRNPFVITMQIAENSAYKHCDKCVSLLPYSKDYMVQHGLNPDKFVNIQNGIVEEEWENYESIPKEHSDFFSSHSNQFIVGYFGGHALSNALDLILDSAKLLLDKTEICFVLVGDGVEKQRLMERVNYEDISNVFFLPSVKKESIPDLLSHLNCVLITAKDSPLYKYGICFNKIYDAMMAGKPIICAIPTKTLVEEFDCGVQIHNCCSNEIAEAIITIKGMSKEKQCEMGKNGKTAVKCFFTYKQLSRKFENIF